VGEDETVEGEESVEKMSWWRERREWRR